jgi:cell division septal protein FtsQ
MPQRLLLLGAAIAGVSWFLLQTFTITSIQVQAAANVEAIKSQTEQIVAHNWWQHTLLTFNGSALEAELMRTNPTIESVDVHRRWPHGVSLAVAFKAYGLAWSSGNQSYLLDRRGVAIGMLPAGSELPVVYDGSNLPVEVGKGVASSRFVEFVTSLATTLPAMGLGVTRYEVKDTTYDLYVTTNKGYRLILDTARPAGDSMADLAALQAFLTKQGKTPVEYVDLRIAGKAYYK